MEGKKPTPDAAISDDELEEKKEAAKNAVKFGWVEGEPVRMILLMDSVDKLRSSVEETSRVANQLANRIKNLTWTLVIIGILALLIGLGGVIRNS